MRTARLDALPDPHAVSARGPNPAGEEIVEVVREEIFAVADEITQKLGRDKDWPTVSEWDRERAAILRDEDETGLPPRPIPSSKPVLGALQLLARGAVGVSAGPPDRSRWGVG